MPNLVLVSQSERLFSYLPYYNAFVVLAAQFVYQIVGCCEQPLRVNGKIYQIRNNLEINSYKIIYLLFFKIINNLLFLTKFAEYVSRWAIGSDSRLRGLCVFAKCSRLSVAMRKLFLASCPISSSSESVKPSLVRSESSA